MSAAPVLHETYYDAGKCSYSGPDDDNLCGRQPVAHIAYRTPEDEYGWQTLAACVFHAGRAIRAARTSGTDVSWHPHSGPSGPCGPVGESRPWPCSPDLAHYPDDGCEVPE